MWRVLDIKYEMPPNLSEGCKDLLQRIFVKAGLVASRRVVSIRRTRAHTCEFAFTRVIQHASCGTMYSLAPPPLFMAATYHLSQTPVKKERKKPFEARLFSFPRVPFINSTSFEPYTSGEARADETEDVQ